MPEDLLYLLLHRLSRRIMSNLYVFRMEHSNKIRKDSWNISNFWFPAAVINFIFATTFNEYYIVIQKPRYSDSSGIWCWCVNHCWYYNYFLLKSFFSCSDFGGKSIIDVDWCSRNSHFLFVPHSSISFFMEVEWCRSSILFKREQFRLIHDVQLSHSSLHQLEGIYYSEYFGFGLIDATKAVKMAVRRTPHILPSPPTSLFVNRWVFFFP